MKRHLLYIDESGSGNLADNSQNLLLTGVSIEEKTDVGISAYFGYIKQMHGLPEGCPFHSYDLFENPNSKYQLSPKKDLETLLQDKGVLKKFEKIYIPK